MIAFSNPMCMPEKKDTLWHCCIKKIIVGEGQLKSLASSQTLKNGMLAVFLADKSHKLSIRFASS